MLSNQLNDKNYKIREDNLRLKKVSRVLRESIFTYKKNDILHKLKESRRVR